jgi:hypothetical protein
MDETKQTQWVDDYSLFLLKDGFDFVFFLTLFVKKL